MVLKCARNHTKVVRCFQPPCTKRRHYDSQRSAWKLLLSVLRNLRKIEGVSFFHYLRRSEVIHKLLDVNYVLNWYLTRRLSLILAHRVTRQHLLSIFLSRATHNNQLFLQL